MSKNYFLFVVVCGFFLTACDGGTCAATTDPVTDADSDCAVDTGGDNCLDLFNPDQFDGDEDGVGEACDADDLDSTVS